SAVIFGQLMSGMARLGRATSDAQLIDKAIRLFEGWRATLAPDGNARMRLYDWDKLVCGLVDLDRYAGVTDALPALELTTAWAAMCAISPSAATPGTSCGARNVMPPAASARTSA